VAVVVAEVNEGRERHEMSTHRSPVV
jgi:hypothetical protein